jgi:aspartyl-tRNA(Asn)/glutamyl-tRNA(Gln) amidotransferase subunit A
MDDSALRGLGARALVSRYRERTLSPVDVMDGLAAQVAQHAQLNAFAALDLDEARKAARASALRWQRGEPLGLLDGVPVSVKDLLHVRGLPTRAGSRTSPSSASESDCPAAARLREQGAILFGKTTTSEFGLKGLGDSPLTGITRNAHGSAHSAGGSSAGAVASIAAGIGPLAVATDGGGSIRVPAAFNGVVGLKPSYGRVPSWPAMVIGAPPHVGPVARNVEDAALLLTVLAGADDRDPYRLPTPAHDFRSDLHLPLRGLSIAAVSRLAEDDAVDPHALRLFELAVEQFAALGARVVWLSPRLSRDPAAVLRRLFQARAAHTLRALGPSERALVDPAVLEGARAGEAMSALDYLAAEADRTELTGEWITLQRPYELVLTPTVGHVAPLVDGSPGALSSPAIGSPYAGLFSLTRQPALSVPMGRHPCGLPFGLQIVGKHLEDALVLRAGYAFERARAPRDARS